MRHQKVPYSKVRHHFVFHIENENLKQREEASVNEPFEWYENARSSKKPVLGKTFTYRSIMWLHFVTITLGVVGLPVKKHYRPIYAAQ